MLRLFFGVLFFGITSIRLVAQQPYQWMLVEIWNATTSSWDSSSRYFATYNANQRMETYRAESYHANSWTNLSLTRYTYVNGTDIDSSIQLNWNQTQGSYIPSNLSVYSYLGPNQVSTVVNSNWNFQTQQYTPVSKLTYTYNAGLTQTELYETYDTSSHTYNPSYRFIYTYTPTNKILTLSRDVYTGGQWQNFFRMTYSYNANDDVVYILGETYQQSAWENSYAQSYSYNMYQELTQLLTTTWNGNSWQQQSRIVYTYNQDGTTDSYTVYVWQTSNFVNSQRGTFFYQPLTNLSNSSQPATLSFYPNPAKDYLSVTGIASGIASFKSIDGKLVHQISFMGAQRVCIADIPDGVYLVEITNPMQQKIATTQLIIQH